MKSIKKYITIITGVLLVGVITISCTKTYETTLPLITDLSNTSTAQVYVATVNSARNYLYMDSNPLNGASLGSGSLFPSQGVGFSIPGGMRSFTIRDTSSTTTQVPLTFSQTLEVGNSYTIFIYDTISSPKQKTVKNDIVVPVDTSCRIRFANFVYSNNPLPAVDVFSVKKQANIFTNVQVTDVTNFIAYPSGLTDTFSVRITGTNVDLMNITPPTPAPGNVLVPVRLIFTPSERRNYTIVFRGSYATILTNASQQRTLSVFTNY